MIENILSRIAERYPLKEIELHDLAHLKASGMKFTVRAFMAEGLGHVSVMSATGFLGLMKMDTLIINPIALDLPLYSYDRIFAMGNDTLIVELYDTLAGDYDGSAMETVKSEYRDIPERDPGEHWYDSIKLPESISKKGKNKQSKRLNALALEHFDAYINSSSVLTDDTQAKKIKAENYVLGLLKNGGPSTDVFKKSLGDEKTEKLFKTALFGI